MSEKRVRPEQEDLHARSCASARFYCFGSLGWIV